MPNGISARQPCGIQPPVGDMPTEPLRRRHREGISTELCGPCRWAVPTALRLLKRATAMAVALVAVLCTVANVAYAAKVDPTAASEVVVGGDKDTFMSDMPTATIYIDTNKLDEFNTAIGNDPTYQFRSLYYNFVVFTEAYKSEK